jgi:hypothetical protein
MTSHISRHQRGRENPGGDIAESYSGDTIAISGKVQLVLTLSDIMVPSNRAKSF